MPLKYMLYQSAVPQEFNEWQFSVQLLPFNTLYKKKKLILQKLNIPFADYGSMQYFVEKVKYRDLEKQTNATP